MKKFIALCMAVGTLFGSTNALAGIVDVRFVNPTTEGNNYCVDVQIRAQDIDFELGSATVFFEYNALAVNNPQFTALNFNESNQCALTGTVAPYKNSFNFLEMNNKGEGNYAILLLYPNQGCPTVSTDWVNVANFCFNVVDPAVLPDLKFNAQYTAFNTSANNGDQLSIGNLYDLADIISGIDNPTGTNTAISSTVVPTVTKDKIWLNYRVEKKTDVGIVVYDMAGRIMQKTSKNQNSGQHSTELDLSKYSNGFYLVEIDNGIEKTSHKVLLAK